MKIHGTAKGGAESKKDFGVAFSSSGNGTGCSSYPDSLAGTADGNVNSATITDATGVPSGIGAKCLNFTASSASSGQSVNIPDNSAFDWTSGGSCTFWFSPHTITDRRFIAKGSNSGWEVLSEGGTDDKKMKFRLKSGETLTTITGTSDIETDGTWYFISAVYDQSAGTMKLYVDGNLEVTGTGIGTINTTTVDVYLGSNSSPSQYYDGLMEEVGIFDYAISTDTIDELYNSGDGAKVSELTTTCDGIVAYYSCQEFDSGDLPNDAIPT